VAPRHGGGVVSDLPDIETGKVSFIAYFNAIDQGGVQSIDPEEVTSAAGVQSTTLYDNGVQGTIDMTPHSNGFSNAYGAVEADFRVKSDGWIVAYLPRGEQFGQEVDTDHDDTVDTDPGYPVSRLSGWWRYAPQWMAAGQYDYSASVFRNQDTADGQNHGLARVIDALRQELSNSGSITYSVSDVGLYNYETEASASTVLSAESHSNNGYTDEPYGFSYTSSTTIEKAVACISVFDDSLDYAGGFEGTTLADTRSGVKQQAGVIDLLSRGLMPNSGTEYQHERLTGGGDAETAAVDTTFVQWS